MPKITAVILHYENIKNTRECVDSLLKNKVTGGALSVIVVNNSQESFNIRGAEIINTGQNLGFAGGMNTGIKEALRRGSDLLLLLNNDIIAPEHIISRGVKFMNSHPTVGLASPKIYFAPGCEYHKGRYRKNDLGKVLWYAGGTIDWKNVYPSHHGVDEVDIGQYEKPTDTNFATGCAMFLRSEAVERAGIMNEKYFLYFEDTDYSLRIKREGFRVMYFPDTWVWHKNAASSGAPGSPIHVYYQTRNRLYFGYRYAPFWTKKSLTLESLKVITEGGLKATAVKDYYLGRMGRRNS